MLNEVKPCPEHREGPPHTNERASGLREGFFASLRMTERAQDDSGGVLWPDKPAVMLNEVKHPSLHREASRYREGFFASLRMTGRGCGSG